MGKRGLYSDDLLTPNAIEIIEKAINMNKKSIGYIFPQISDDYNNSCEWENMDKKLIDILFCCICQSWNFKTWSENYCTK